jgi:DNA repair exonuclease SbcCD ATPase subunit
MNKFLPLNLQFFAADTGSEDGSQNENPNGQTSDGKENTETKTEQKEHMIPKSRFDEVNNNYKALKDELDKMKAAQKKAEDERLAKEQEEAEKRGEFEGLYKKAQTDLESVKAEHKSAKARVEALEGVIQGLLDAKLEAIDKEYHDLIPEGMTPEQKLAWVTNAEKKGIFGRKAANEPLGEQTNPRGNEEVDINKMNPLQMLLSGYSKK